MYVSVCLYAEPVWKVKDVVRSVKANTSMCVDVCLYVEQVWEVKDVVLSVKANT